jgi:hypothetical protein
VVPSPQVPSLTHHRASPQVPSLSLLVSDTSVTLLNNEIGFTERDVRAVCNLGASTKVATASIGRKGIGFKSVFMVTDHPHVLSAGFSFKFDTQTHGLYGYVCPENVSADAIRAQLTDGARTLLDEDGVNTCIFLPRRQSAGHSLQINEKFDGTMLLFLRNLQRITVFEEGIERRVWVEQGEIVKTDDERGVLSVCKLHDERRPLGTPGAAGVDGAAVRTSTTTYRVYRRSGIALPPHLGPGTTEITLAFPDNDVLEPQQIFTFLPVCHSGLPFAVNAQFELVSSRQQVHEDSLQNQFLRDEIAPTLVAALDACEPLKQRLGDLLAAATASSPFWAPVVTDIVDRIRSTPCLLTESGRYVLPEAAIRRPINVDSALVRNTALARGCGVEFVDSSMCQMAERLGCREFALEDLAQLIKGACGSPGLAMDLSDDESEPEDDKTVLTMNVLASKISGLPRLAYSPPRSGSPDTQQWLRKLYQYINIVLGPDDVDSTLWTLKIFPIIGESGEECLESLASGRIFSSLDNDDWLFLRGNGLRVLVEGTATKETAPFLDAVGIQPATRKDIVQTILAHHREGKFGRQVWEDDVQSTIWKGLQFLRDNYESIVAAGDTSPEELANTLLIPTLSGMVLPARECAVSGILGCGCPFCFELSKNGVPCGDLQGEIDEIAVAITPIQRVVRGAAATGEMLSISECRIWENFFLAIGVGLHSSVCATSSPDHGAHAGVHSRGGLRSLTEGDPCPICFESLPLSTRSSVLPCGHRFCPDCIMGWLVASSPGDSGACPLCRKSTAMTAVEEVAPDPFFVQISSAVSESITELQMQSNTSFLLRTALGLMAKDEITRGVLAGAVVPTTIGPSPLSSCFCGEDASSSMKSLLPQVNLAPGCTRVVAAAVGEVLGQFGISASSTLPGLIHTLKVMRQAVVDGYQPEGGPGVILAAFASCYTLIERLVHSTQSTAHIDEFAHAPLIYVGIVERKPEGGRGRTTRTHTFMKTEDVVWRGNAKVLAQLGHAAISTLYGATSKGFFDGIGIKSFDVAGCWEALRSLAAARASDVAEVVETVKEIYEELEREGSVTTAVVTERDVHVLVHDPSTNRKRVVSCTDELVLLNDDPYAYDVFADSHRVWLDTDSLEQCPRLFAALCGGASPIKSLSACVTSRSKLVVSEPLAHEREWTLWARQCIEKTCTSYGRSPSAQIRKLSTTLTVLRAEKISMSMKLRVDGDRRSLQKERTYPLVTDQDSGRIILSRVGSARNVEWVCRQVGAELGTLMHEFWEVCGREQLEWQCYAHLMAQCGRCPKPLRELGEVGHNARIGSFGYGGPRSGRLAGHQINRKRPAVEFPASLPPPLKTEKLMASPPTGGDRGGRPENAVPLAHGSRTEDKKATEAAAGAGAGAAAAAAAAPIADTPAHVSAELLRQQVSALQAQLAEQARMLDASQQTIRALEEHQADGEDADQLRASLQRRDDVIRRLNAQVERLSEQAAPPTPAAAAAAAPVCPEWATPCRHGARCLHRGDPAHAMALWHP